MSVKIIYSELVHREFPTDILASVICKHKDISFSSWHSHSHEAIDWGSQHFLVYYRVFFD
jgi:hypothetical protein